MKLKQVYFKSLIFQAKWTGRGGKKKKNPMKPNPWGEELWKLCDNSLYSYHMFFSSNR
jgi:hypothetical protein